jgi:hypothetical protein
VELGRINSTGKLAEVVRFQTRWSQGETGNGMLVIVPTEVTVLVRLNVLVAKVGGTVVVTVEVAMLVLVVSRAGATMRLADRMIEAMMMAAAAYA